MPATADLAAPITDLPHLVGTAAPMTPKFGVGPDLDGVHAFWDREHLPAPNWSRPLPRPIIIPDVMQLEALADVRILVEKHLPREYRSKFSWRQLAGLLRRAAEGQEDLAEVSTALRIVLQLEGVPCR
jgi:hypothetical protein